MTFYAGATVMGDGKVALILDAIGLGQRVGVVAEGRTQKHAAKAQAPAEKARARDQVLLCRLGSVGRVGIPLSKVARLEELPISAIERAGGREVTQYREQILPLVRVQELLEERRKRPRGAAPAEVNPDSLQVVVYSHHDRSIGLVVDDILDIVEVALQLQRTGARAGVLGSMVVQERVTELLDVEGIIRSVDPTFFAVEAEVTT
jgi:two-component system chemotaxis sensor kinase CheA